MEKTVAEFATSLGQAIPVSAVPRRAAGALGRPQSSWGAARRDSGGSSSLLHAHGAAATPPQPQPSPPEVERFDIPSLRPPRRMSQQTQSLRPPFASQLAAIASDAGAVTGALSALRVRQDERNGVAEQAPAQPPVLSVPALAFHVGPLRSRRGDTVRVYHDRVEYCFIHPLHALEVEMVMYRLDLLDLRLLTGSLGGAARTVVAWRLAQTLDAFRKDLEGARSATLAIEFVSPSVALRVRDLIS